MTAFIEDRFFCFILVSWGGGECDNMNLCADPLLFTIMIWMPDEDLTSSDSVSEQLTANFFIPNGLLLYNTLGSNSTNLF